ncbi:MAG: HAD hydrolase family protein [Tessaracoccus sp.]|uniref:HAD hydrolase family protein n=1 Tax=Tessaracoccus sp. TaxID=1971211 RepID=UPI001EBD45B7|nr:HAD hydrolase family protein [Tessaracoccus sp.]MBK7820866.1 HAD hydrolase family protein [Tessaracoccus sp.]
MAQSIFIDFDGTLAEHGEVPPAHLAALADARRAGHLVFLCTGRPKAFVPNRYLHGVFDGIVCAAGGYVEIDGQVLADIRFPQELAARTAAVLVEHDAMFTLEAPDRSLTSPSSADRLRAFLARIRVKGNEDVPDIEARTDLDTCSFSKVSVMDSPVLVDELARRIGPEIGALPSSITGLSGHAGELYLKGVDKSVGIATVERHLGLDRADIVAIGDGMNDLEMLGYAGTGIAVAGAPDVVLAAAQRVIPGPAEAGVAHCFAELGLIS